MSTVRITRDVVERARARAVADPSILIQGSMARKPSGQEGSVACAPTDPEAKCFCTLGLIANEAGYNPTDDLSQGGYDEMAEALGYENCSGVINKVIRKTDAEKNTLRDVKPCFEYGYVAGLAGFDYLLEQMK